MREDFMMEQSLILVCLSHCHLPYHFTTLSAMFSSKLPPHSTSDIMWPFFSVLEMILYLLSMIAIPVMIVSRNPTHLEAEKTCSSNNRSSSSSGVNNKCNHANHANHANHGTNANHANATNAIMRQTASCCQQQTR